MSAVTEAVVLAAGVIVTRGERVMKVPRPGTKVSRHARWRRGAVAVAVAASVAIASTGGDECCKPQRRQSRSARVES